MYYVTDDTPCAVFSSLQQTLDADFKSSLAYQLVSSTMFLFQDGYKLFQFVTLAFGILKWEFPSVWQPPVVAFYSLRWWRKQFFKIIVTRTVIYKVATWSNCTSVRSRTPELFSEQTEFQQAQKCMRMRMYLYCTDKYRGTVHVYLVIRISIITLNK